MKMKHIAAMLTAVSMLGAAAIPASAYADPAYFTTYADAYKTLITEGEQSIDLGKYGIMNSSENGLFGVDKYCLVDTNNDGIKELFTFYTAVRGGGTDESALVAYDIEGSVVSQGIAIPTIYMIGSSRSENTSPELFWLAADGEGLILHFVYGINPIYSEAADLLLRWNPYTSAASTREAGFETIYDSDDTVSTEIPAEVAQYFGEPVEVYDADNLEPLNELIPPTAPATPTITSALPFHDPAFDGHYVRYTWQPVANADGYEVHFVENELGGSFGTYENISDASNATFYEIGSDGPMIEVTAEVRAYKETANGRIYSDWSDSVTADNDHTGEINPYNLIVRVVDAAGNAIYPDSITVGDQTVDYSFYASDPTFFASLQGIWQNQGHMQAYINPQTEISVTATKDGVTATPVTITATEEAQTVTIVLGQTTNTAPVNTPQNPTTTTTPAKTNGVATGDAGSALAVAGLLTAAGAAVFVSTRRKEN